MNSAQPPGPLLTLQVQHALLAARQAGATTLECSLDLERSRTTVTLEQDCWHWQERAFPYLESGKDRTVYYWAGERFEPVAHFGASLIKLVPTEWGAPTFEIDGIKMLPTAKISPFVDAGRKVGLIAPQGKAILDTCAGLGYFAAWCLRGRAAKILSYEKNPDVIWLRTLNPWSPEGSGECDERLTLIQGDIAHSIAHLPDASFDAILHDPPRFGIAGELYSLAFYEQLARVMKRAGKLFHYTGLPNLLTSGRNLPREVMKRLTQAGFAAQQKGDGVLAMKRPAKP